MIQKKTKGFSRIIKAAGYSLAGLKAAFYHEAAFRQEFLMAAVLMPLGFFLGRTGIERALLISSLMIVIVTELLNSAIEAVVDHTGLGYSPLAKQAKDMGSAAVFISLTLVIIVWSLILI